jgi:solute carrier family 25 (adenine nucleotide translocator) protein 4/5/6/31
MRKNNIAPNNMLASFLVGWSVTVFAGAATYPLSTIQKRMVTTTGGPLKYRHALHAFNEINRREGVRGLYGGFALQLLHAIGGAAMLTGYELLVTMYG